MEFFVLLVQTFLIFQRSNSFMLVWKQKGNIHTTHERANAFILRKNMTRLLQNDILWKEILSNILKKISLCNNSDVKFFFPKQRLKWNCVIIVHFGKHLIFLFMRFVCVDVSHLRHARPAFQSFALEGVCNMVFLYSKQTVERKPEL